MAGAMWAERSRSQGMALFRFLDPLANVAVLVFGKETRVEDFAAHQAAFNCLASRCSGRSRSAIARAITSGRESTLRW